MVPGPISLLPHVSANLQLQQSVDDKRAAEPLNHTYLCFHTESDAIKLDLVLHLPDIYYKSI